MSPIRQHLRSNVVGYVAVFIALTGTASALDGPLAGQDTVGSADIIDNEVSADDVRNDSLSGGGLGRGDLRTGSVRTAEVQDDNLRSEDILDGQIKAIDVAFATLRGDEIQDGTLGGTDIGDNSVQGDDVDESTLFNDNSLTTADLADDSVGKGELKPASVGASEVGESVVRRPGNGAVVQGGTEGNGSSNIMVSGANCDVGEELVGATAEWLDNTTPTAANQTPGDEELYVVEIETDMTSESVTAIGANDTNADHTFRAVALCLTL